MPRPRLAKNWPLAAVAATGVAAAVAVGVVVAAAVVAVGAEAAGAVVSTSLAPAGEEAVAAVWAVGAEASSLEAVLAALPAVAAAVAPARAGYGHQLGAGSTAAGVALHPRLGRRLSRRSKSHRQTMLRENLTERVVAQVPNSVRRLQSMLCAIAP